MAKSILSFLNIFKNIYNWSKKKVKKNIEIYCPDRQYILIKLFHNDIILSDSIQGCFFTDKEIIRKFGNFKKGEKSYSIKYEFSEDEWSSISVYLNRYLTKKGEIIIDGSFPHKKMNAWVKYDTSDMSFYGIPKYSNIFVFFKKFALASLKSKFFKEESSDDLIMAKSEGLSSLDFDAKTEDIKYDTKRSDASEDVDVNK